MTCQQPVTAVASTRSTGATAAADPTFLRLAAGTVYFFFGFLKFYPDLSPAELLAGQSIMKVTFQMVDAQTALFWLAIGECLIGLSFMFKIGMRWLFFVFLIHQASTFLPLFVFPEITFKIAPFAPTMEGQYILKNLVSVAAGWTVLLPAAKAGWADSRVLPWVRGFFRANRYESPGRVVPDKQLAEIGPVR